jgi:hypothetical protein
LSRLGPASSTIDSRLPAASYNLEPFLPDYAIE